MGPVLRKPKADTSIFDSVAMISTEIYETLKLAHVVDREGVAWIRLTLQLFYQPTCVHV